MIEIIGFVILVMFVYYQWDLILLGLQTIRNSDVLYLVLALTVYWLALPVTTISFKLLSDRHIPLFTATVANLAGSGPGRIIPGGLGRIGFMALHLRKLGMSIQKSVIISVANNLFGFVVNTIILWAVIINQPDIRQSIVDNFNITSAISLALIMLMFAAAILWISHIQAFKKSVNKWKTQGSQLVKLVFGHPSRSTGLVLTSLIILLSNLLIMQLCALALGGYFSPGDLFIALSIGVVVGGLLPTPGGIGGVEAGIAGCLILLGYDPTESTSIALLYRVITYWQPLLPGTVGYFYLRERNLL